MQRRRLIFWGSLVNSISSKGNMNKADTLACCLVIDLRTRKHGGGPSFPKGSFGISSPSSSSSGEIPLWDLIFGISSFLCRKGTSFLSCDFYLFIFFLYLSLVFHLIFVLLLNRSIILVFNFLDFQESGMESRLSTNGTFCKGDKSSIDIGYGSNG